MAGNPESFFDPFKRNSGRSNDVVTLLIHVLPFLEYECAGEGGLAH